MTILWTEINIGRYQVDQHLVKQFELSDQTQEDYKMQKLQTVFNLLPQVLALNIIMKGQRLLPDEVGSLLADHHPYQLPAQLRDYAVIYPPSEQRDLRGRPRKFTTADSERTNMVFLVDYWKLILEAPPAEDRGGRAPRIWAAKELNQRQKLNITLEALLNKVSRLRYYVDMRSFWEFVIREHGEQFARQLRSAIKPNRKAIRRKIKALSDPLDKASEIVWSHHHRSLKSRANRRSR